MNKVVVVYWSGTGNTEMMAEAVLEGVSGENREVKLLEVENAEVKDVVNADAVALGCPSMGAEALEENSMEPFVDLLKDVDFSDKKLALFGSYDWGDGQWMRDWEERMEEYGAKLVDDGLIINLTPDEEGLKKCRELGEKLLK